MENQLNVDSKLEQPHRKQQPNKRVSDDNDKHNNDVQQNRNESNEGRAKVMFGSIKKNSRHLHINDHHNSNITGNANEANSTDSKPGVRHLQNQLNPKINKPRQASNHNIESLGHNNNDKTGTFIGNHNNNNGHNFHLRNGSGDNIASKPNNTGTNVDMFDSNYNGYQLLNRPTISIPVQNDTYSYKQTKVPNKLKNVQDQHIPVISTNKPNGSYRNQGNKDREKKTVSVEQDKHSHAQVHSQFYKNQYINGNGNQQKQIEQINKYFNNESDNEQADILQGQQIQLKSNLLHRHLPQPQLTSTKSARQSQQYERHLPNTNKQVYSQVQHKHAYRQKRNQGKSSNAVFSEQHKNIQINDMSSLDSHYNKKSYQFIPKHKQMKQYKNTGKSNVYPQNIGHKNIQHQIKVVQPSKNIHKQSKILQGRSYPSQFIDSRHQNNNGKYGIGGLQTLQFNPQKQKFIVLDSKQTQGINNGNGIIGQFCSDFDFPILEQLPTSDRSPEQLVLIAKNQFIRFGCNVNDQTVINVRKYKNCVHFSISNQENILYHYQNGKTYYGSWKMLNATQGQKHGQGIQILPGKYKFKGLFLEGKKSGLGTLICFDGTAYVGQWQNGLRHGVGKQLDIDGIIYQGQWKQGKKSGYGKLFNNERLQFQGVFIKGLKNGYGRQFFQNGDSYDGNYLNHKFEGQGTYSWSSGASYTGQFKSGKRNGYGIWKSSGQNYDIYQGQYLDDKKHGRGVYKWANGSTYQGQFRQDLKHGTGTITYQNGKVTNLIWINGKAQKKIKQKGNQLNSSNQNQNQKKFNAMEGTHSKTKNNFILRNRVMTTSRSTQNLNSARSLSTNNSQGIGKGINFNTRSVNKLPKNNMQPKGLPKKSEQIIRLKFDNKQFEKVLGKNWNKNLINPKQNNGNNIVSNRPEYPKDRPYQGIQFSNNLNMEF